jgi:hypothetical protein
VLLVWRAAGEEPVGGGERGAFRAQDDRLRAAKDLAQRDREGRGALHAKEEEFVHAVAGGVLRGVAEEDGGLGGGGGGVGRPARAAADQAQLKPGGGELLGDELANAVVSAEEHDGGGRIDGVLLGAQRSDQPAKAESSAGRRGESSKACIG